MGLVDLTRFRGLSEWVSDRQLIRDNFDLLQALLNGNLDAANLLATALPGHLINYTEITLPVTVTGSEAAPNDVVSSGAFTYDGTAVRIEFFAPYVLVGAAAVTTLSLWDGATNLGMLAEYAAGNTDVGCYAVRCLTPSAASHTYKIRAWRTAANGEVGAGVGGSAGVYVPAFVRVAKV